MPYSVKLSQRPITSETLYCSEIPPGRIGIACGNNRDGDLYWCSSGEHLINLKTGKTYSLSARNLTPCYLFPETVVWTIKKVP